MVDVELGAAAAGTGIGSGAVHCCWHSCCYALLVGPFFFLNSSIKKKILIFYYVVCRFIILVSCFNYLLMLSIFF